MEIEVPKDLSQIKLKDYQKFLKLENPSKEDTISILLGVDKSLVRRLKSKSVAQLSNHLKSLFTRQFPLIRHFKLDGKEFGFIPDLDSATYGENSDIEDFISSYDTMHRAMGVMFRPVTFKKGRSYLIEPYQVGKYDELMKEAPVDAVLGANVFFWTLISDLLSVIPNYMTTQVAGAIQGNATLVENGEDIINSLRLQAVEYSTSIEQAKSKLIPPLPI